MSMKFSSKDELLKKLRNGDEDAFELLFREYFIQLCLFAEHYVKDSHAAKDIVEELFCELWDNSQKLNIHISLNGYLYKSVCNRCLKYLRHKKIENNYQQKQFAVSQNNSVYQYAEDHEDPCTNMISKELENKINHAIEKLPPQCAKIFSMSRFRNMSYSEISEELSISINTVKTQITKALRSLRDSLKE